MSAPVIQREKDSLQARQLQKHHVSRESSEPFHNIPSSSILIIYSGGISDILEIEGRMEEGTGEWVPCWVVDRPAKQVCGIRTAFTLRSVEESSKVKAVYSLSA
jgi:hypothetical protein